MSLHSIDPSNLDWTTLLVTLGAGLAAATYFHRCVYRGVPPALPPPGGLQTKGTVQLERGDVGGEEEVSPSERQSARETVRICTAEPACHGRSSATMAGRSLRAGSTCWCLLHRPQRP